MTANRANADAKRREVYDLADALLGDTITAEQAERLNALVCDDAEARQLWLQFVCDAAMLREWSSAAEERHGQLACPSFAPADEPPTAPGDVRCPIVPAKLPNHALAGWAGNLWSPAAVFGSVPLGYAVAAVILCVGILGAWWCNVPHAGQPSNTADTRGGVQWSPLPSDLAARGRSIIAGQITEMIDCRWGDGGAAAAEARDVPLGRAFDLISGRLTIRFNGGDAKVTLVGPAKFEVIALRTGFLALGRASCHTSSVRARGGLTVPSGFGIRTPSCLMRDRGADIVVEVDRSGASLWQLSRGQVDLWYPKGCMRNDGIRVGSRGKQEGWVYWSSGDDKYRPGLRLLFGVGQPPLGLATLAYKDRSKELKAAGGPLWLKGLRPENHVGELRGTESVCRNHNGQ